MENVRTTVNKALELSKLHRCPQLLFDIRKCPIRQTLLEGFEGMSDLRKSIGLELSFKIAIVYDPAVYPTERAQFIENVVVNRANPAFRMFSDYDEALAWLIPHAGNRSTKESGG